MKYRLQRIIRRVLNEDAESDDLAVDRSLDREIRMAPGRLRSPESKYGWQDPDARYGRANQDTFNIVRNLRGRSSQGAAGSEPSVLPREMRV